MILRWFLYVRRVREVGGRVGSWVSLRSTRWIWVSIVLIVVAAFMVGALWREADPDAARSDPSAEAELAMLDAAIDRHGLERVIDTGSGEVTAALVLGRELVTAGDDGLVQVWGRSDGRLLGGTEAGSPLVALAETESSSRFLAAIDSLGRIGLLDVTDPGLPRILPFEVGLDGGERPLAVAFSKEADEVVAVGARGAVLRVDVTTGEVASRSSIWDLRGDLPWDRGGSGELVTAKFVPDVYEDEEGLLVATAAGAVADLDLGRGQGKTIVRAGVAPGRVLSLDRVSYGEPQVAVGTSEGLVVLGEESYEGEPDVYPGPPMVGVAISAEGHLVQGGKEGLSFGEPFEGSFSGPAIRRFDAGFHGIAAILAQGKVSVLGPPEVGISMAETESTPVAAFDSEGRLLVAEGYDANHVEELQAVRPRPREVDDEFQVDEVVQTYRPDSDWWPDADDPEALYLNDVAADDEYVAAAGQDPNGNAVVLVWDADSGEPLQHLDLGTSGFATELPSIVTEVAMLPGKQRIAAYSAVQELVAIWSTETWKLEDSVPVGAVGDISVSPDESTLVAVEAGPDPEGYLEAGDPTKLTFVDLEEGQIRDEVQASGVSDVALSPDGSTLAMADQSGFLRLRSADGLEPRGPLVRVGGGGVEALAWRPDGELIAIAFGQGGVVLVDPESGDVSEPLPYEWTSPTVRLAWNAEGTMLAALKTIYDEEDGDRAPGPTAVWTLGEGALERRMCELAACEASAGAPLGEQLGDASRLDSIDLVFREDGELLAADRDGEKVRIGYLEGDYPVPPAAYDWSRRGLAWSSPGQVSVLLAGEEKPRSWPCACSGIAWDGSEVISLAIGQRRLVRIDPERGTLRATPTRGLPPYLPSLLGVVGDTPVVSAFESEPDRGTPSALFELGPGGTASRLTGDANGSIYLRSPSSSPDSLAFLAGLSAGICFSTTNVGVVSSDGNGGIDLNFPPSPFAGDPTSIRSLQVGADGAVSAAIAPIGCSDRGYPEDELPLAERYLLEDGQWRPTGEEGFDVQNAGGAEVLMEVEDPIEPGRLLLQTGEGRKELAPRAEGLVGRP